MRILIIEDDKSLAETLRFQLEREHFETDICHDGVDGLHFIEQIGRASCRERVCQYV